MIKKYCFNLLTTAMSFVIFLQLAFGGELPKEITDSCGIKMVLIPAGSFLMGSKNGKDDEKPAHEVELDSFYMDVCEVTQESFQKIMGVNPSKFKGNQLPVERVRWTDAALYCNIRSEKEGLKPCYDAKTWECDFSANGYRLPTEAEWEYACRAGSTTERFFSGAESELGRYACFRNNSNESTQKVGTKKANPFGLYDIYGNLAEWCNDFYEANYYSSSPAKNPHGPQNGDKKVVRGGSWASRAKNCLSSARAADAPTTPDICQGYDIYGFRCVRKIN